MKSPSVIAYIPQLDAIRAIAVILVVLVHWLPEANVFSTIHNGAIGMDLFFVLSGFLITRILLNNKFDRSDPTVSKWGRLKNFYFNRVLRIFPIYYITLFILLIFEKNTDTDIKSSFLYYFTYSQNFFLFFRRSWDGILSHFWSLAVEEQFYLCWPLIIAFMNKKQLFRVLIVLITVGFVSQILLAKIHMVNTLTFVCFDALGLGALLAWQITCEPGQVNRFLYRLNLITIISLIYFVCQLFFKELAHLTPRALLPVFSLFVVGHIVCNHQAEKIKLKFILNNRVLIFIGKISYGIYIYHNIIPYMLNDQLIDVYLNSLLPDFFYKKYGMPVRLIENTLLLLLISWLSYIIVEKPFLQLKRVSTLKRLNRQSAIKA